MPYKLVMYVDGGCRGNGHPNAFAACACIVVRRAGPDQLYTQRLPDRTRPIPTNQRAELQAIILALKHAIRVRERLRRDPYLDPHRLELCAWLHDEVVEEVGAEWFRQCPRASG